MSIIERFELRSDEDVQECSVVSYVIHTSLSEKLGHDIDKRGVCDHDQPKGSSSDNMIAVIGIGNHRYLPEEGEAKQLQKRPFVAHQRYKSFIGDFLTSSDRGREPNVLVFCWKTEYMYDVIIKDTFSSLFVGYIITKRR